MTGLDLIYSRRSIRDFIDKPISDKALEKILRAAMYAPSARNNQPWYFIVVNERGKLDQLAEIHPYGKMLKTATLAVLVCGDLKIESSESYLLQDCSAATQNILLAAKAIGIGSVWLGIQPRKERIQNMIKYFGLPDHIIPVSLIALGYYENEPKMPERFQKDRIRLNSW